MSNTLKKGKIIAVIGTTASGKTRLGVYLAVRFNGEIVSADSRQVYRGMDIGTGKDLADYIVNSSVIPKPRSKRGEESRPTKEPRDPSPPPAGQDDRVEIPYHLIDIAGPNDEFSLADYQKAAYRAIDEILARGKLPVVVGGSGLYLQAVIDGYRLPEAKPDIKARAEREKRPVEELFAELSKLNPKFAEKLNDSDRRNKRRLIRYLETQINTDSGQIGTAKTRLPVSEYETLVIGLTHPKEELDKRIHDRLIERLEKENMVGETERLNGEGVSYRRLEAFGLEYKYTALYLQNKIEYDEMAEQLLAAIKKFAKRQMTWFRRWEKQGRTINWVNGENEAESLVKKFISEQD